MRTGEDEPAPEALRQAVRDVVSTCIYGVDLNPMAVELCKFNMWLESLEPGRPLSFLDHHFRVGNSLIGATPELIAQGIPDGAFSPVTGDDKGVCSTFRKRNRQERTTGQHSFLGVDLSVTKEPLESEPADHPGGERDISEVHRRESRFHQQRSSPGYLHRKLASDAWCAAFMWRKTKSGPPPVTTQTLRQIEQNPATLPVEMRQEIERLCRTYSFFHWEVEFPEVFGGGEGRGASGEWGVASCEGRAGKGEEGSGREEVGAKPRGGFDVVLGNPPWERIKLQEKEWFASRVPEIANARNKAEREKLIRDLIRSSPGLHAEFEQALREAEASSQFVRESGRFPLCGRGDVNTYTLFAELNRVLIAPVGRAGCVVPSGIATDDTTKEFFQSLTDTGSLVSLFDFENRDAIFPGVHRSYKFCLLTVRGSTPPGSLLPSASSSPFPTPHSPLAVNSPPLTTPHSPLASFVFFAHSTADLKDPEKRFSLSAEDIALLNPNTRTCPVFRSKKDAELTKAIYRRVPVLIKEARDGQPEENSWGIKFMRMFDMSNDSHLFRTREQLESEGWKLKGNVFGQASGEWRVGSGEELIASGEEQGASGEGRVASSGGGVERYLPLYEAKMIHHFDHRWATYDSAAKRQKRSSSQDMFSNEDALDASSGPATRDLTPEERADPFFEPLSRYWVSEPEVASKLEGRWSHSWLMGWRDITNTTNERTLISGLMPVSAVGHKAPVYLFGSELAVDLVATFQAMLSSFALDFCARQKTGGTSMTYFYLKQFPVLPPSAFLYPCPWSPEETVAEWIKPRVLELIYTSWSMKPFAEDLGFDGPPFPWDDERRFILRCELDAALFHLYGCSRSDADYILDTFPIIRDRETKKYGTYRTKETILSIYDAIQRAIDTGEPYQTILVPLSFSASQVSDIYGSPARHKPGVS